MFSGKMMKGSKIFHEYYEKKFIKKKKENRNKCHSKLLLLPKNGIHHLGYLVTWRTVRIQQVTWHTVTIYSATLYYWSFSGCTRVKILTSYCFRWRQRSLPRNRFILTRPTSCFTNTSCCFVVFFFVSILFTQLYVTFIILFLFCRYKRYKE